MTMILGFALVVIAAGPTPHSEIRHLDFLEQYVSTSGFRLGQPVSQTVTTDGKSVLFLRSAPRSFVHDLYEFDCETGEERILMSADDILEGAEEELSVHELARRERQRKREQGIASFSLSRDDRRILAPLSGQLFLIDRVSGRVRELTGGDGFPLDPRFSPDGRSVACVRDGDLRVIDIEADEERRLTRRASERVTHGLAEFVAQEEMLRPEGYWWSPDSRSIAYLRVDVTDVETMYIVDPAKPYESPVGWPYPRAGGRNASVTMAIQQLAEGDPVWVEWDRDTYPYLVSAVWDRNAPLTLVVHNRTQTEALVLAVDEETGATNVLHRETDAAWVQFDQSVPRWVEDGSAFLWSTERAGGRQLELRARDGRFVRALHPPSLQYRKLLSIDDRAGFAWIQAWTDPTELHLFRLPLEDSGATQQMSTAPGLHVAKFSIDGDTYVDELSPREGRRQQTVHRGSGEKVGELGVKSEEPMLRPNAEYLQLGAPHEMHSVIIRPRDFVEEKRYPVLVRVYGGPFSQMVKATEESNFLDQWFAENGFIVVKIDGRGTPGRGREWERAIKGNLIEIPLADQVMGLRQLAARYPELDIERTVIYGWSFGGYFSAMAVIRRPDVFLGGVAGAPVVDWRDYSTYYTERYMGLPEGNPDGYEDASVLTHVDQLERPLMIVHGTADDNVYFLHSMKLVDALFHHGKEFEFVPLTNLTHSVRDVASRQRLYERILRFLRQALRQRQ